MKSKLLLAAACVCLSTSAFAVQVVTQGGSILVADNDAVIPSNLNFSLCGVVIGTQNSVNVVDISSCSLATIPNACTAIVDLSAGTANLPCVTLKNGDGTEYVVNMVERGNSMNWEVTFVDFNYRRTGRPAP